jgi:copper chaperone CopZ
MDIPFYMHVLDGRLRIKVPEIKRSPEQALQVEAMIEELKGVISVKANPTTGNVLVLYHSHLLSHADLIGALRQSGYLRMPATSPLSTGTVSFFDTFGHAIARSVTEALMERAILSLL